jgi:hypothetical protein
LEISCLVRLLFQKLFVADCERSRSGCCDPPHFIFGILDLLFAPSKHARTHASERIGGTMTKSLLPLLLLCIRTTVWTVAAASVSHHGCESSSAATSGTRRIHPPPAAATTTATTLPLLLSLRGGGGPAIRAPWNKSAKSSAVKAPSSIGGGTATIPNEIFNLVKAIVGVGVLSLPAGTSSRRNCGCCGPSASSIGSKNTRPPKQTVILCIESIWISFFFVLSFTFSLSRT